MALTAAICTQCGAQIQVDESKEAGICPNCGTAFITEKVIHNFVTNNNFAGATINVQGGVDIENLYTLARRAVDANNKDDVLKYYGQIRERNPNDWEATFFYAWFENEKNFNSYLKIAEDLIFKLEQEKQIEAADTLYNFFKKINFSFYNKEQPFPLKDNELYYNFLMRFFNEKNEAVIEHAMYLTNFMYKRENFYFEILNRNDSIYSKFIQTYRSLAYSTPNTYASDDECVNIIKSAETDIEKINMSFESEEDKKDTYLKYYKWLIEECADRLKPASIQYIEARINELCLSYTVTDEVKKIAKKNLHKYNAEKRHTKAKKRRAWFSKFSTALLALLSIAGIALLYKTSHPFRGFLSLITLGILNLYAAIYSLDYEINSNSEKIVRVTLKLIILFILIIIFLFLNEHEFFWI